MTKSKTLLAACLLTLATFFSSTSLWAAEEPSPSAQGEAPAYFATVGNQHILAEDYQAAVAAGARKRFYHARVPEEEMEQYRREVAYELIDKVLLLEEARNQGVGPDETAVAERLIAMEERYSGQEGWAESRDQAMAVMREIFNQASILERFEARVRQVAEPTEEQVIAYYRANPEKFTTPQKDRVAVILLKVNPSSPKAVWDEAREEGQRIYERLQQGEDFALLAEMHSSDPSAENGGDMGYLHLGMLSEEAQAVLDGMKVGDTSEPTTLLQGVAIFRLLDTRQAQLNPFEDVAERARALYMRDTAELQWESLLGRLRATVSVEINEMVTGVEVPFPPETVAAGAE